MASLSQLELSEIQLLAFPVLLIIIWRSSLFGIKVPIAPLCVALASALVAGFVSHSFFLEDHNLLVSRLANDDLEIDTRILRERINSDLGLVKEIPQSRLAKRYFDSVQSHEEALALIKKSKTDSAVLWGDNRWLNISFPTHDPKTLSELGFTFDFAGLNQLQLITSVPMIGMSYQPRLDTARFLALLISGSFEQSARGVLRDAAQMPGIWSNNAHRAYAWWLLGNRYLSEQLPKIPGKLESAGLDCAEEAFRQGLNLINQGANSELQAALFNNLGIVLLIKSVLQDRFDLRKEGLDNFAAAYSTLAVADGFKAPRSAPLIARLNYFTIRRVDPQRRRQRNAK